MYQFWKQMSGEASAPRSAHLQIKWIKNYGRILHNTGQGSSRAGSTSGKLGKDRYSYRNIGNSWTTIAVNPWVWVWDARTNWWYLSVFNQPSVLLQDVSFLEILPPSSRMLAWIDFFLHGALFRGLGDAPVIWKTGSVLSAPGAGVS